MLALEQIRSRCFQVLQISIMEYFEKMVSNADLNNLTILAKSCIWDAWRGPDVHIDFDFARPVVCVHDRARK